MKEISLSKLKEKLSKKELKKIEEKYGEIDNLEYSIFEYMYFLNDSKTKNVKETISNKSTSMLDELIKRYFVFNMDGEYYFIDKIKKAFFSANYEERINGFLEYCIRVNGVIRKEALFEIMINANTNATKTMYNKLLKNFIVEDAYVYLDEITYNIINMFDILRIKNDYGRWKCISLKDYLKTILNGEQEVFDRIKNLKEILGKYLPNNLVITKSTEYFCYFDIGDLAIDIIKEDLHNNGIKNKELEKELFDYMLKEMEDMPSWIYNGYSYNENKVISQIKVQKKEFSKYNLINGYLLINGVIGIDVLVDILKKHHNEEITRDELIEYINNNDFDSQKIKGNYVYYAPCIDFIRKDVLRSKRKDIGYKIIEDINKFKDESNEEYEMLENIKNKYTLSENAMELIEIYSKIDMLDMEKLKYIFRFLKEECFLSLEMLYKDLEEYNKNIRLWSLNGYKKDELIKESE